MQHYQGHLRDAFANWVDDGRPANVLVEVNYEPVSEPAGEFLESFLGCSDVMPGMLCDSLGVEPGTTYGDAAGQLLPEYAGARN